MPISPHIKLGCLTRTIADNSAWRGKDGFPSDQVWADEIEKVLSHIHAHGQFDRFLPRLRGVVSQRDGALAEARISFFFDRNQFRILSWEPEAVSGHPGDLEIQWQGTPSIFVEVKGPGWEAELSEEEKRGPRKKMPKYINAEARWFDPAEWVMYAVEKAIPKFASDRPNMLVVADDLFLSPIDMTRNMLDTIGSEVNRSQHNQLGGVLLFKSTFVCGEVVYRTHFIENQAVDTPCTLPPVVVGGLLAGNRTG